MGNTSEYPENATYLQSSILFKNIMIILSVIYLTLHAYNFDIISGNPLEI